MMNNCFMNKIWKIYFLKAWYTLFYLERSKLTQNLGYCLQFFFCGAHSCTPFQLTKWKQMHNRTFFIKWKISTQDRIFRAHFVCFKILWKWFKDKNLKAMVHLFNAREDSYRSFMKMFLLSTKMIDIFFGKAVLIGKCFLQIYDPEIFFCR